MDIALAVMKGVVSLVSKKSREEVKRERENGPQLPSTHDTKMGKTLGHSCLAFARAGLGYLYVESETKGDNERYAEKGEGGKMESCWRQTAQRRV